MAAPNGSSLDRLGTIGGIDYLSAKTSTPWSLPVDVIVVSVGSTLGNLGVALRSEFDGDVWDGIDFGAIVQGHPRLLRLPPRPGRESRLRRAVLISPHDTGDGLEVTNESLRTATEIALETAARTGATAIAVPLLATGALGLAVSRAARTMLPVVVATMTQLAMTTDVRELVFIAQDGVTLGEIRSAFAAAVADLRPSAPGELAGGVSRDLVDPNSSIELSSDRLGLAPYVSMLATVIADRATPLPLSVGVFGEWGSGKSYFMAMLRERIRVLTAQGSARHCSEIVQIGFNAWHYADTNLWASLGDEIFRQLGDTEAPSGTRAARIRDEIAANGQQQRELENAAHRARDTVRRLQEELDRAVSRRETSALNLLAVVSKSSRLRGRMAAMWRQLGIVDEQRQAQVLVEQLNGTVSETRVLVRAASNRLGRLSLAITVAVVGLAASIPVLVVAVRGYPAWGIGVSAVATCLAPVTVVVGRLHAGLKRLRDLRADMQAELRRSAQDTVSVEMAATVAKLRAAQTDEQVARAQLDKIVGHLGELGGQLAELAPGRQLYTFLAERVRSGEYTNGLGLVSTIRKDLARLDRLMKEWREDPDPAEGRHPIDRIVLYIDDLDRCAPAQVVDVLQAVHLLLAFDLFVVVVGVDPRWLLRSLEQRYSGLLREGNDDRTIAQWQTPEEYLHKILNIPLRLPRMSADALGGLLQSLADVPESSDTARQGGGGDRGDAARVDPIPPPVTVAEPGAGIDIETGSEVDTQSRPMIAIGTPLPLTPAELRVLGALDLFVATPRDAKRLLNLYRMVRSTRELSPVSRFIGFDGKTGEFEAVAILLAIVSGFSALHGQLFDSMPDPRHGHSGGLAVRPSDSWWDDFVADVEPIDTGSGWRNGIRGSIDEPEVSQWSRLYRGLGRVSEVAALRDLSDLQLWLPRVRRFTYSVAAEIGSKALSGTDTSRTAFEATGCHPIGR